LEIAATTSFIFSWDDISEALDAGPQAFYHGGEFIIPQRFSMAEPSYEELRARLQELEKQVETKKRSGAMEFKVSEKGGVSVYGLGRFPVTLYYEQWTRLLDASETLRQFLEENKSRLKLKGQ
jgi:hypothetical protein